MSQYITRFIRKDEYDKWDRFVSGLPSASIFDETKWLTTVSDAVGGNFLIAAVFNENSELSGGVTLNVSRKFGMPVSARIPLSPTNSCLISPSLSNFPAKVTSHVLEVTESISHFLRSNFDFVVVTNNYHIADIRSFMWQGWRTSVQYTYHIDLESVEIAKVTPARRNHIQKAAKAGIVIKEIDDPNKAYEVLEKTFQKKGVLPPITRPQFAKIYAGLQNDITLLFAVDGKTKKPIAVSVILKGFSRSIAYSLMAGFDSDYKRTDASSFVKWGEIEYLKTEGFKKLDLVGAEERSVAAFKADFSGTLIPYYQVFNSSTRYRILNRLAMMNPF